MILLLQLPSCHARGNGPPIRPMQSTFAAPGLGKRVKSEVKRKIACDEMANCIHDCTTGYAAHHGARR